MTLNELNKNFRIKDFRELTLPLDCEIDNCQNNADMTDWDQTSICLNHYNLWKGMKKNEIKRTSD